MSDDAQIDLNGSPPELPTAPVALAATPNGAVSRETTAADPSKDAPNDSCIIRSLAAFRPQHRRILRAGMAVLLIVLAVEWVVIVNRRPDPLLLQRSDDFRKQFRVDINSATWIDWLQLGGIGPTMAHRIVADRKLNGPFASIDDVKRVPGIGPVTLDRIRPWLTMGHDQSDSRTADAGNHGPSKLQP